MKKPTPNEFSLAFSHVEKLLDRRQATTSFFLSVNTAISAVIGLLLKDTGLSGNWLIASITVLLCAGFISCWIWRLLLQQYKILLDWWYARLRELEVHAENSAQLVTREYEDLYLAVKDKRSSRKIGITKHELALNGVFFGLYITFTLGILVSCLT